MGDSTQSGSRLGTSQNGHVRTLRDEETGRIGRGWHHMTGSAGCTFIGRYVPAWTD